MRHRGRPPKGQRMGNDYHETKKRGRMVDGTPLQMTLVSLLLEKSRSRMVLLLAAEI